MIKIEHPDLDKIAKAYFDNVKTAIKRRCSFFLLVLDVFYSNTSVNQLSSFSDIHWKTKISIYNLFLTRIKISSELNYSKRHRRSVHSWININHALLRNIISHLNDDINLEDIILCKPKDTENFERGLLIALGLANPLNRNLINFINRILDYSLFDDYAYDICKQLNVNTCPYCNRNYINTVINKKDKQIIRPTFDHFFPQSKHPFLALSFYNLVPSCYYCNSSTKNAATISIDTHIHPYKEGFDKDATFHVLISNLKPNKSDPENYTLLFADNMTPLALNDRYRKIFGGVRGAENSDEGNINLFKLKDIYQSHCDIVGELVVKCDKLSNNYANSLQSLFESLGTNREEFYQYYFGNYYDEKNFHRRPMAKLSKDVVSQMIPNFVK